MKLNVKYRWGIFVGSFFVLYFVVSVIIGNRQYATDRDKFYPTTISGKIEYVQAGKSGVFAKIYTMDTTFFFITDFLYEKGTAHDFTRIAKINDSIYKPAYSDTIKLITKGREYLFAIQHGEHDARRLRYTEPVFFARIFQLNRLCD